MSAQHTHVWEDDGYCYLCGKRNPEGFKMEFALSERGIETSFVAEKRHQGYRDILHGGFLAMAMDEVMVMLPYRLYGSVVATAEFTVRLIAPVAVGERVTVRAAFDGAYGPGRRLYRLTAECRLSDGTLVASGRGTAVRVR
ncbi:MAG: PaaI family thioesterase [Candidatus Coatesbacteria bacterium]